MTLAYIALGSNLSDPPAQLQRAVEALERLPQSRLEKVSSIYRSTAAGLTDQPDFLNAVAGLHTMLDPDALLTQLQAIETQHGRERSVRWGPRPLDLDLLLYGSTTLHSERLTLPHPRMHERDFVLRPLREIAAHNLVLPNGPDLDTLLATCPNNHLVKTDYSLTMHRARVDEQQ